MKDVLESRNATAVMIGSGPVLSHRLATRWLRLPWPIVRDPERATYRRWGLERALAMIQRSGTFVIDSSGIVRFANSGLNPASAFPRGEIIAALDRLTG